MKKLLLVLLVGITVLGLAGCAAKEKNVDGSLVELMAKVYEGAGTPYICMQSDVATAPAGPGYYIGYTDKNPDKGVVDVKFTEGLASEPFTGSQPHSVVLLRLADDQKPKDAVDKLKNSVDGRKWICVGAENVIVDNIGNLVIIIVDDEYGDALLKNFKALAD